MKLSKLNAGDVVYLANGHNGVVMARHMYAMPFLMVKHEEYNYWYQVFGLYTSNMQYSKNPDYNIVKVERYNVKKYGMEQLYPIPAKTINKKITSLRKALAKLERKLTTNYPLSQ